MDAAPPSPTALLVKPSSSDGGGNAPKRYIYTQADMEHFRHSSARKELLSFVSAMGRGLTSSSTTTTSTTISTSCPHSYNPHSPLANLTPALASLHGSLQCIAETWMVEIPPDTKVKARFGNPEFRTWHARLVERSEGILKCLMDCHVEFAPSLNGASVSGGNDSGDKDNDDEVVRVESILKQCAQRGYQAASSSSEGGSSSSSSPKEKEIITELRAYLHDSFGHPIRIDYGTGHESSFIVFLLALCKIGCFSWSGNGANGGSNSNSQNNNKNSNNNKSNNNHNPYPEIIGHASLSLFHIYLQVTRGLQRDYMLEPAGSHGVWGLDDYHCVPFYLGACQMVAREQWQQQQQKLQRNQKTQQQQQQQQGQQQEQQSASGTDGDRDETSNRMPDHPYLPQTTTTSLPTTSITSLPSPSSSDTHDNDNEQWTPSIINDKQTLQTHRQTYLYLSCIHFIQEIKPNVPFFESSPMLHDISHLANWTKVTSGLLRLYEGEVLDKMPVVQHFVFGTIFCANWTPSKKAPEAPKWNFINGPMGEECIAPWAVRDREGGSGAAGGGAAAGVVGSSSNNSVTSGTGVAGRQGGQPPSNYPGGMPPTRAPWAK